MAAGDFRLLADDGLADMSLRERERDAQSSSMSTLFG